MARLTLTHMKNKTQTLEGRWRKGINVPKVFLDSLKVYHMTKSELFVYISLIENRDYDKDTLMSYPTVTISYTELTDYVGIYDRATIRTCIKKLEDKKLIKVDRRCLTNVYTLAGFEIVKW